MIDQQLLAKLTSPNYGPAIHGFSQHIDPPPADKIEFYITSSFWDADGTLQTKRATRPTIPWDAFDKFDSNGKRICRIKGCGKKLPGGQWKSCGYEHSELFRREVRYYDWDMTRWDVEERDGGRCVICKTPKNSEALYGEPGFRQPVEMQCDHIIPWAYVLIKFESMPILEKIHRFYLNRENLRTLCAACHRNVTARFLAYLPKVRRGTDFKIASLTEYIEQ